MDKRRILLAASESDLIEQTKEALSDSYVLEIASSKDAGLERAKEKPPEMIIIGFIEPRDNSFELYAALEKHPATQDIPILVIDVRPEEHSQKGWQKDQGMQLMAEGYLTQPVAPDELRRVVARIIGPQERSKALDRAESALEDIKEIEEQLRK